MAIKRLQKTRKTVISTLTAIFMGVALIAPTQAAATAHIPDPVENRACVQEITPSNIRNITGYSNLDDLEMASAYASFMRETGRDPTVLQAILDASEESGVDFELMIVKAILESSLGQHNQPLHVDGAARGLYQYMPATWLTLFSWFGERYNDGEYRDLADAIEFDDQGNPYVSDETLQNHILELRNNHYVSAFIKAMQTKYDERYTLRSMLGHEPTITDYYIAHFLGIPRARTFYQNLQDNPDKSAVSIFRKEARYNHYVFYRGNTPRSFQDVYNRLERIITNRLQDVRNISNEILEQNNCITPLRRNSPPAAPGPAFKIPVFTI